MSREDKISQLFINNEHKLEEAPPSDLWGRIETKLDKGENLQAPTEVVRGKTIALNYKKIVPYIAAAAVLLLLIVAIPFFRTDSGDKMNLAENNPVQDVITRDTEETLPTSESEKVSAFENKDRIQQNRMLETAKKNAGENKKAEKIIEEYGLDRIEINEKSEDLIVLTVEPTVDEEKSYIARPKAENNDLFSGNMSNVVSRNEYQQAGRAYADPPVITQLDNLDNVTTTGTSNVKSNSTVSVIKSKSQKRDNSQKLDGQMQIFEWLLGQWSDKEEEGGKSSEIWRKLNNNSIECTGTKVSGKNKIFEEKITIYLDKESNRIFLKMPIDDYKKTVVYMMTAHNLDRIVFEQTENQDMPANLVLQRNLNGYSIIINSETKVLKPAQQTYFEQRNRVSDTKVLRILTPTGE